MEVKGRFEVDPEGRWFHCKACQRTSYHPQDVTERWCNRCKQSYKEKEEEAA